MHVDGNAKQLQEDHCGLVQFRMRSAAGQIHLSEFCMISEASQTYIKCEWNAPKKQVTVALTQPLIIRPRNHAIIGYTSYNLSSLHCITFIPAQMLGNWKSLVLFLWGIQETHEYMPGYSKNDRLHTLVYIPF